MAEEADKNGKPKGSDPPGGFFGNLMRPWIKQRVTLTKPGKGVAPVKGRAKKAKKAAKKAKPAKKKVAQAKKLPTKKERQVNELKMLAKIGRRDPERLASIITKMLLEEEQQTQEDRRRFERLVWENAEKHDKKDGEAL